MPLHHYGLWQGHPQAAKVALNIVGVITAKQAYFWTKR